MNESRSVAVSVALPSGETVRCGTLAENPAALVSQRLSFAYDPDYLALPASTEISPDLPLHRGWSHPPAHLNVFPGIGDAMPDAWGRRLVSIEARRRGLAVTRLTDFDHLTLIPNNTRQGNLSFDAGTPDIEVPDLGILPRLASAMRAFDSGSELTDPEALKLLPLGTSQGGARPKAAVAFSDGALAIAKFPAQDDRWDVGAWEGVAHTLARRAGLPVSDSRVCALHEGSSAFVAKRFDRTPEGGKIGYWSAQTLMLSTDTYGVPYTDLASFVLFHVRDKRKEGERIVRQAAFNVLISNVDDHLRNYGLLHVQRQWSSSPAFDLNPYPHPEQVEATPLTPQDDPTDRQLHSLVEAHAEFNVSRRTVVRIVKEVEDATRDWVEVARALNIDAESINQMAPAFENAQRQSARDLAVPD